MKELKKIKNENGAITILTAVLLTVLIGFTALSIDIGFHYYMGAKLQNAVDAAATAVGANLEGSDGSLEDIALSYLKKNGYDADGKYKDNLKLSIERKGVLNYDTIKSEDDYITTGYYKITVELDDKTSFAHIFDIESLHLIKSAYVKCSVNYNEMPRALQYTIFGGSTEGTQQNAAVKINGRTGATVNEITASFENVINGINSKIVQPIKGIFGKNPDYNSLVNINLSEVITNGDVHSNSNISIGVQALNASRLKDQDFDGEVANSDAYEEGVKDEDNTPEDYGQVTYTAVTDISFNSSLKLNRDSSTHLFVQNQQYIEQTQAALNILNTIENFDLITSTASLKNAYTEAANAYFEEKTNITESQKAAILNQSENLVYESDGTYVLNNQSIIVYDVSQQNAERFLENARQIGIDGLVDDINKAKTDMFFADASSNLLYMNTADKANSFNYGVLFTKHNKEGDVTASKSLNVNGTQVNRDTSNIYAGVQGISMHPSTEAGAQFAIARTFRQNSDYITIPNMKPYFVRQVNKSIRAATKSAQQMGDSEVTGDRTVREAVSHMGKDLSAFLNTESYTDDKYASNDLLVTADTSPLFTNYKQSFASGLTPLTGSEHTSYKGYSLYGSDNRLNAPNYFINDFKNKAFAQNAGEEADYGAGAVAKAYNEKVANNTETKNKYATNYSADAVLAKKDSLSKELGNSFESKKDAVEKSELLSEADYPSMPSRNDVFLGPDISDFSSLGITEGTVYKVREEFNNKIDFNSLSNTIGLATYIIGTNAIVTVNSPASWADGSTGTKTISSKGSSGDEYIAGKYFTGGNSTNNKSVRVYAATSNEALSFISGNLEIKRSSVFGSGGNLDVGNSGDSVGAPATIIVTGNINVAEEIQVRSNSVVICLGSITCKKLTVEDGGRIYCGNITVQEKVSLGANSAVMCSGKFDFKNINYSDTKTSSVTANKIEFTGSNKENLSLNGIYQSTGDFYVSPRLYLNADSVIKCKGNFTMDGDKDYYSFNNYGKVYIEGNFSALFKTFNLNSELYVCGNFMGCNSSNTNSNSYNIIEVTGTSRIYIGGCIGTTSSSERNIYIYDGSNSVFSVYGYDRTETVSNRIAFKNVKEFCNIQSGSKVYIGDARLLSTTAGSNSANTFDNPFYNYGSLYCYSALILNNTAEFKGAGESVFEKTVYLSNAALNVNDGHKVYFQDTASTKNLIVDNSSCVICGKTLVTAGDLKVNNSSSVKVTNPASITGVLDISSNSSFVCKKSVTVNSLKINSNSKFWCLGDAVCSNVEIESDSESRSEFYCGGATKIQENANLVINGYFYTNSQIINGQRRFVLKRLEIKRYGYFACPEEIVISESLLVQEGGVLYTDGKVTLANGASLQNNNCMYLVGGLVIDANTSKKNNSDLSFSANSDTFIGTNSPDSIGSLTLNGYYFGNGNVYIENNLIINGFKTGKNGDKDYVYNRGEAVIISSGNTYVSGDINCVEDGNGVYIESDSSLSCKNLTVTSSIYSGGSLVILENLNYNSGSYPTDKGDNKFEQGYCLLNGGKSHNADSFMYIGGTNPIVFGGIVENWGKFYSNAPITVNGYYITSDRMYFGSRPTRKDGDQTDYAPHFSIINGDNAVLQTSADISCRAGIYNLPYSTIASEGNIKYGMAILNGGNFVAGGDVGYSDNCWKINHIEVFGADAAVIFGADKKGSYSIVNGFVNKASDSQYNRDAVFFAGGDVTLGTKEYYSSGETDKIGGTFQNWGKAYFDGALKVFSNKEYSYNISSIILQGGSDTFIKDNCFSSSVTAIMDNSIFMCGGDYQSKRATKINIDEEFLSDNDKFTPCYVYVGGNMLVNTSGLSSDSSTNTNTTRKLDIYSNSNVYIAGSLYANCELNIKQNVNLLVGGQKVLNDNASIESIVASIENGTLKQTIRNLLDETDYKLFGYQHLTVEPCSKIVVNGSSYIRDTAKIRDMTKTYIYGDFRCGDYVEIGKALDGMDETEAKEALYKAADENDKDYKFSNAAYMAVGGDFYCSGYNKIYASAALRVKGDYVSNKYLTLRHDAKIVVGKKLKAATSIDVGSYSTVFVGGSMQAVTSTIKLRDCTDVFVGGNMTALSYIELGKAGDFLREYTVPITEGEDNIYDDDKEHEKTHNNSVCPDCKTSVKYNNKTVTYIKCDNDECGKYIKAAVNCPNCGTSNYYAGENFSCGKCGSSYYNELSAVTCDSCSTVNPLVIDMGSDDDHIFRPFYIKCTNGNCGATYDPYIDKDTSGDSAPSAPGSADTEDTAAELANDSSDKALGSRIYIGKKLVSYTGYIKEFAYSRVAVGEYVFTPKYVTLRHNADLWIMPETFNNSTYQKKAFVSTSDGSVLGDIIDALRRLNYEISQTFAPKAGSLYTLGELTLNKNASLMGTYDCIILGQCVLRQDSLVYMGHDFNCSAPSVNISLDAIKGNTSIVGFDSYGTASASGVTFPVVVYANNDINISTTVSMSLTYLVANKGNVNLYDIYSRSENAEQNAKQLPNSICSYQGNINYFAMYGKIGALFYAPNGNVDLDGYYMEIWGSCIGNTVDVNTYYLNMHRFTNWRTMDLHIAESGNVYLVSENEYNHAEDNIDDIYMFGNGKNPDLTLPDGAQIFY